jgi:hypothetical protein
MTGDGFLDSGFIRHIQWFDAMKHGMRPTAPGRCNNVDVAAAQTPQRVGHVGADKSPCACNQSPHADPAIQRQGCWSRFMR